MLLVMTGSTAQAGWLFVLAAGLLGLIGASVLLRHSLFTVSVTRHLPPRATAGTEMRYTLQARNLGRRATPLMTIEDRFPALERRAFACASLPAGEGAHVSITARPVARGVFDAGEVDVLSGWPFGLFVSHRRVEVSSPVVVVPSWADLATFPLGEEPQAPERRRDRASSGTGIEYLGVREYRPGDAARSVHWRSSARAGALIVREYEEEVHSEVAVVVAGRDDGQPPDSSFEALVSAAASVSLYASKRNYPVRLLTAASDGSPELLSGASAPAILDRLATVGARDVSPVAMVSSVLAGGAGEGCVVLVVASAGRAGRGTEEALRLLSTHGRRVVVVAARSETWSPGADTGSASLEAAAARMRAPLRWIAAGAELGSCLSR